MIVRILLDGLWQGVPIVGIAGLVVRCVPRRNATTRYAVWFAALMALVAVPIVTAISNAGALLLSGLQPHAASNAWTISLVPAQSLMNDAAGFLSSATGWIVVGWSVGVGVCLVRLGTSLVRIDGIRGNAAVLSAAPGDVLVSDEVSIPVAVGFFKPAIVIPKVLAETLAPADLEHILAHERAHLRRQDVLANLGQRLVEAFLFFNPWVHLVGRNLVLEREAACDDWAVLKTGAPDEYAACLTLLAQKLRQPRAPLATPSALGSRHTLVERIERLADSAAHPIALNYYVMGGTIVLFAMLSLALEAFSPVMAFAPTQPISTHGSVGSGFVAVTCTHANVDAQVTSPAPPILPHGLQVKGAAVVAVAIAPNGSVTRAKVLQSSGNAQIDQAVLNAADHSKYSPKLVNCEPVEGQYLFKAEFVPNGH